MYWNWEKQTRIIRHACDEANDEKRGESTPLLEEVRGQHRVCEWHINLPEAQCNEADNRHNNGRDDPGTVPRMLTTTPVQSKQQEQTAACEENQTNVVNLLDQLPFCLLIMAMLGLKRRRMVEEVERDGGDDFPGKAPPVYSTPRRFGVGDENVAKNGGDGADMVGQDHHTC